jgi:SM-20-related protein
MDSWYDTFEQRGWVEIKNFLSEEEALRIRAELIQIQEQAGFKQAGIGKHIHQHVDTFQRGDFIHWINPEQAAPTTQAFLWKIEELFASLNYMFYLGIRDYECHYAHYPPGTFYKKHVDRHSGGSARRVSFVFYLNQHWQATDGGELRIYDSEGNYQSILPELGTLALFLSELEHEVMITSRDRMSITGWMLNEVIL